MITAALLNLGLGASLVAAAPVEVHTATRDVRDCRALADGGYVAATDGGVLRLDAEGRPGPLLTALDGLPDTRAYVLEASASADALWVGTEGGLAKLELAGGTLEIAADYPSEVAVRAVIEHDGRTYVGSWGEGLLELRDGALEPLPWVEDRRQATARRITDLEVHNDQLFAATAGAGVWRVDAEPEAVEGVEGVVWSLAAQLDTLYAGTLVGTVALDGPRSRELDRHDARALALVDGELLVASRSAGLVGQDPDRALVQVDGIAGMHGDRCLATSDGLWIRDPGPDHAKGWRPTLREGLPSGDITAMVELGANRQLAVATFDKGVWLREAGRWTPLHNLNQGPNQEIDPQVNALADAGDGRLWVATARGLHRVGPEGVETWTQKRGLPHASVLSLTVLRSGELLVGTHAGVAIVDERGDLRSLGHRARRWATWAAVEGEAEGELWLGTTQGLIHWQPDGRWRHISMLSGQLSDNWVTALLADGDELFVGTYAGGVDRLAKREGEWIGEALGGGRINPGGLSLVDGKLHAATMKGLLRRDDRGWTTLAGAALFEDVTGALAGDAGLWIASRRGLVLR